MSRSSRGPRRGRPAGHFTQARKLDRLRKTLESHPEGLSLDDLAGMLHVTTRSVRRYLQELDRVTELESVPQAPGGAHLWRIKPSERGRALLLRRTQAYALLAARTVFEPLRGSALYDELDLVTRQLVQLAHRPTARAGTRGEISAAHRLEERLLYAPHPARNYAQRGEELDALFQAVADLRVVRFRLRRREHATAHPYALFLHRGGVVCVARLVEHERVVCLQFEHMNDLSTLDATFDLPDGFDPATLFDGEFGLAPLAAARVRVLVEFDARVADEVRHARVHPTQRLATSPDGRIRLSMNVANVDEVRRWVLGFGDAARVIEPLELATSVADALDAALARYRPAQ